MKKLFYFLLTAAAALSLASCVKDPVSVPDPAQGGEPVAVSFSLSLGDALTKAAPEPSDFDKAAGEFKLYAAVFSKASGALISTSKIGGNGFQPVETITTEKASVVMTLSRNQDYKVVFFAMHDGAYDVNFADNNVATFSYKSGLKANDASLDAFYASVDVTSGSKTYNVTLKRPFAQVNVLVPTGNVPTGQTTFSSSMTVKAPASFNLFSGAAGTDLQDITFANNAIAAAPVGAYKTTHKWIGMNFVLVPSGGKVNVSAFTESGMKEPVVIGEVPVKVNSRTNIVGNIYSLSDFTFNLQIDPTLDGEEEHPMDDEGGQTTPPEAEEDTEITIADGKTYTESAPMVIDASGSATPKSVLLRVNGDDFATVEKGAANGAKITAASSNAAVATAEVKDGAVLVTPKGNGKAKITVSTPAYTKAGYAAQTFDFWVEVTGMTEGGGGGDDLGTPDTIVFADLNLENGTQYKDPFTQGNMSVQFGAGSNDGKYYTTGTGVRVYGDGWVTVSSQKTIVKIEYTFDPTEQKDGDAVKTFLPDEATFGGVDTGKYDLATQTWTGSAKSVTLTRATGTGHWRLQKVSVYYADGEGGGSGGEGGEGGEGGGGGQTPQEGNGTQASPYTVAKALAVTNALEPKGETADKVYVKGKISEITDVNTGEYGNATYFISDDGSKTGQLQVFRGYYLEGGKFTAANQIAVGDEVIVYGKLKNYQNSDNSLTPEVTGSQIYSLNGKTASGSGGGSGEGGGQGSGGDTDTGDADATLTLAEIKAATADASITDGKTHYGDVSITSASGTWTGNIARNPSALNYMQLRNKNNAHITSPLFSSAISKVVVTMATDKDVTFPTSNRVFHAIPPSTVLPNGKDQSGNDITYSDTEWASQYGYVMASKEKGEKVTINFAEGSNVKQFKLIVEGGAVYIDQIEVYY